jgi:hypothetical protein
LGDKKSTNLSICNTTHKTLSNFTCHPVYPHYLLSLVANYINYYPLYGFLCSNKYQVVRNESLGARIRIRIRTNPVNNRIRIRKSQNLGIYPALSQMTKKNCIANFVRKIVFSDFLLKTYYNSYCNSECMFLPNTI